MTVRWNGRQIDQVVTRALAAGLYEAAEMVGEESDRTAPIEEGTLIRSRSVTIDEANAVAAIAYDTPYAARQHEDLTLNHDAGRRAKFLEQSLRVNADRGMHHVAGRVREAMR